MKEYFTENEQEAGEREKGKMWVVRVPRGNRGWGKSKMKDKAKDCGINEEPRLREQCLKDVEFSKMESHKFDRPFQKRSWSSV